jgi:GMP synthase (glutamine-hydrolysing)
MKRAVCLQHVPFEGPGCLEPALGEAGFSVERRLVPAEGLPADAGDALLVMGGPMSVNDPDPWIRAELEFIRRAVAAGTPYLGICLGAQFLARALGGRVGAGAEPEIGMTPIRLTPAAADDPLFRDLPLLAEVFEWHGEGIEPPTGAVVLASSSLFPVQAFRIGRAAYGLLFHLELDSAGVSALCAHGRGDLARAGRTAAAVSEQALPHLPALNELARRLVRRLLSPRE